MSFELFKVYLREQLTSVFLYLMLIFLVLTNYNYGIQRWNWYLVNPQPFYEIGVTNFTHWWNLWSASYAGGLVLLLWGIWIFWQIEQPRSNGLLQLLYSKPLPYLKAAQSQLIAFYTSGLFLFVGGIIGSNLILSLTTGYQIGLYWLILPPLISYGIGIIFYTTLLYLISTIFQDWLVLVPLHFILWLIFSSLTIVGLDYRNLSNLTNPFQDLYLYQNRILVIIITVFFSILLKYVLRQQEKGLNFSLFQLTRLFPQPTADRLLPSPLAKIYYSIKIYYSWRLLLICSSGLFLGSLYTWRIKTSNQLYSLNLYWAIILMISQATLSLLGIITTLHLARFEERANTFSLLKTLPAGGLKTFGGKLIAMAIYFVALLVSFSLPLHFLGSQFVRWNQYFLALLPPFLFLFTVGYLVIMLSKQSLIGYIASGGLWLLFLIVERKIPYWLQPFFEIAEYRFPTLNPYWINKGSFLGLSVLLIAVILIIEYRKLTGQK